ncbi:MAG: CPBP family intramembrane glutamic endopeptidase, partial [Clostridium sp.]
FGTLIMWVATYLVVTLITLIVGYFFPESLNQVSEGLNEVITSIPMWLAFIFVAIMPAICEEVLTRGFIQASFHNFKSKWSIVVLVGIIFGIFHLDFVRFFPTAILGGTMAYIMFETKNLVLPMFLHFINNGLSTLVSFLVPAQEMANSISGMEIPMASIGSWFIVASAAPFAFLLGSILIHKKGERSYEEGTKKNNWSKKIYVAAAITVVLFIIGVVIMSKFASELVL